MTGVYTLSLSVPGQTLETFVGADINTIVITNLLSGMDYNVKIFASQAAGFSDALTGLVKTRKPDLMSSRFSPTSGSLCLVSPASRLSAPFSVQPLAFLSSSLPSLDGILWKEGCGSFSGPSRVLVGRQMPAAAFSNRLDGCR